MRTVSCDSIRVWLPNTSSILPEKLASGTGDEIIPYAMLSKTDMTQYGWVEIGSAQVSLTIKGNDEIVSGQVEALKAQKRKVIADAEVAANEIEQRIQSLLAITFDPA